MSCIEVCKGLGLAVAGLVVMASTSGAQSAAAVVSDDNAVCTPGVRGWVGYGGINASDAPYSATVKVVFDQKMSDGKVLHGVTRTFNARSSDGKVRMETSVGCEVDKNGHASNKLIVRIADSTAGTFLDWNIGGAVMKVAQLLYQPERMGGSAGISEWAVQDRTSTVPGRSVTTTRIEPLGTKMISGVEAAGQRMTTTVIPVNMQGDTRPSVTIHERWISIEHGLLLADMIDSPDRGRTEMVLENLSLKEPDPALFVPPEGYTIVHVYPKTAATTQK
jgi:hypothetical protein